MPTRMMIAPTAIAAIPAPLTLLEPAAVVVCRTGGALVEVVPGTVALFWGSGPNGLPCWATATAGRAAAMVSEAASDIAARRTRTTPTTAISARRLAAAPSPGFRVPPYTAA